MQDKFWVSGSAPNAPSIPFEEMSLTEAAVRYCLQHGGPQRVMVHNSSGDYCMAYVGIITDYTRKSPREDFEPSQRLGVGLAIRMDVSRSHAQASLLRWFVSSCVESVVSDRLTLPFPGNQKERS